MVHDLKHRQSKHGCRCRANFVVYISVCRYDLADFWKRGPGNWGAAYVPTVHVGVIIDRFDIQIRHARVCSVV